MEGLEQGRRCGEVAAAGADFVVGLARPKREAWVLAGFEPESEDERERLKTLGQELGFDPTRKPERLDAGDETAKRSAKRALKSLSGGDHEREASCWRETPLEVLRERGQACGLAAFLSEVDEHLVPLVAPGRRP